MLRKTLSIIDNIICVYLGLETAKSQARYSVKVKDRQLRILQGENFKRHIHEIPLNKMDLDIVNEAEKRELGVEIGRALATRLVVTFENIVIHRDNLHAK